MLAAAVVASGCGLVRPTHFKINTDVNQLLAANLPWRQNEAAIEKAFPQNVDLTLVVIDGDTPDAADAAATALAEKLQRDARQVPDGRTARRAALLP